jgi:5'-3' exonuclease
MEIGVFCDGNWLLYRAYSVVKDSPQYKTKTALQVLSWFVEYSIRLRATHGALCFDGAKNFRVQIYPEYKANRSDKEKHSRTSDASLNKDAVYECLPVTQKLFQEVGLPCFQVDDLEADDLLAAGAFRFTRTNEKQYRKDRKAFIGTLDKDLLQCVDKQVCVWNPETFNRPETTYDIARVCLERGLTPKQFRDFQILIGDKQDNVPALMSDGKAKKLVKAHGSLKGYLATEEGAAFFEERKHDLLRNKQLITMRRLAWHPDTDSLKLQINPSYKKVCADYGQTPSVLQAARMQWSTTKRLF